jgi:cytochrome c
MKSLAVACVLWVSAAAPALASQELAQKKNCLSCHAVDVKRVGPAYKDVAAKYANAKDAVAVLAAKVIKGGSGTWGVVPMPANPQVSEAEAKSLVQWILTLK